MYLSVSKPVEEPVFTLDEEEYTKEQLLDAIKDSTNRKEWQAKNTQKAQDVSNDRKAIEPLVQLINRVKGNDDFRNVLGDAIEDELIETYEPLMEGSFDDERARLDEELARIDAAWENRTEPNENLAADPNLAALQEELSEIDL